MKKIASWFVVILGIFLVLNLLDINQIGTPLEGVMGWIFALFVLFVGVTKIMHDK